MPSFLSELKRRNVYKVAVAYAVVGWLLIQIATQTFPFFDIPNWAVRLVVLAIIIGFPIALVLAWAFEMTPEGIARTDEAGELPKRRRGRAWIYVVAIGAALSVGLFFLGRYTAGGGEAASSASTDRSIAVLPLVNQSGDPAQEYFSDGLTEELINGLGQIPELRVIGRNSSFHLKGKGGDSRAVGQALGVAHLLEGSVRKMGDRVRIGVQLVNAADGTQRWSDTYNRELKDIFAVQEEIAKAVADQLRVRLLGDAAAVTSRPSNQNLAAYNAFLQAKYHYEQANVAAAAQAIPFLDEAIRLDPNYAEAYVLKARALYVVALSEGVHGRENFEKARAAAKAALALKPDLAGAHAAMAYIYLFADWNLAAAETELAAVKDKHGNALNVLALLRGMQSRWGESIELRKEAILLEPLHAGFYMNLAQALMRVGRLDEAEAAARKALELQPAARMAHAILATLAILRGDLDVALREAEFGPPASTTGHNIIAIVRFARGEREEAEAALQKLIEQAAELSPVSISLVYAFTGDVEKMFEWLDRAYQQREPTLASTISSYPFFQRYYSDPRFVALCHKIGMPVPK